MSILIFIAVLAVLILVHELGHFIAAKRSGIRVDEFAIGFPPKLFGLKKGETQYSINAIPFGGYVKIFGENPDEESMLGPDKDRSFVNKSKLTQAWVLSAGVLFNLLFAWLVLSLALMIGMPTSAENRLGREVSDPELLIVGVLENSPAHLVDLRAGDSIESMKVVSSEDIFLEDMTPAGLTRFISNNPNSEFEMQFWRSDELHSVVLEPREGILEEADSRPAIGVMLDEVGFLRLAPHIALWDGLKMTVTMTIAVAVGLSQFIANIFIGSADFSEVAGPIGIAGLVGEASAVGFVNLMIFTAFISINLAIINLIPFPALDGGRLLFVLIESIKGSAINPKIANSLNIVGFALLILLMIVVTYNDILRLFT